MSDMIEQLHRKLDTLSKELDRVKNNSAPTLPIYDSTNFPQDAVDGQVAVAQSSTGVINQNSLWTYRNGAWQELGSGGDIRFNYDNEGGYLSVNTNDFQGMYLSDTTPSGFNPTVASNGIVISTNWSADSEDLGNAGPIRLIDTGHNSPLQIWKTGAAGEGAGIQIFADSGPPGDSPGLHDGDLCIQQFGSGRLYIGAGNLSGVGNIQIEAWARSGIDGGSTNLVKIDSISGHHTEPNIILVGNIDNVSPSVQSILLENHGGSIGIGEDDGIFITANYMVDGNLYPIQIRGDTVFDELFSFIPRSGLSDPPIPTDPTGVMIYAMGNPITEVPELWAYCGGVRTRLAHG